MPGWLLDWTQAARALKRRPATAVAAALCLALGLGACATALRLVDRLSFQPPAHVEGGRSVARLYFLRTLPGLGEVTSESTSYPTYLDLRRQVGGLGTLGAFSALDLPFGLGAQARKLRVQAVTGSYLQLLGVRPLRGRLLEQEEGEAARPSTAALLSEDFWRGELAASPAALGGPLRLGGTVYTVVGILPSGFTGVDLEPVDVWLPLAAVGELLGGRTGRSAAARRFFLWSRGCPPACPAPGWRWKEPKSSGGSRGRRGRPIPTPGSCLVRSSGRAARTAPLPPGSPSP